MDGRSVQFEQRCQEVVCYCSEGTNSCEGRGVCTGPEGERWHECKQRCDQYGRYIRKNATKSGQEGKENTSMQMKCLL
ncbi:hypothetical protein Pcinc_036957 [Petrolisthes cinctipes]|uniref:Uncharacterized protein n=1 Tax=Petrolisthes cinctipes TaxID=88211 RepID=A0AAE1BXI4_PETCI|nr:hypothetical protein Pcinc_036957 [Petrolisthes cinctipes]